jgi:hypothetical protein
VNVEEHVLAALKSTPIHTYPFPFFFAENVFPAAFYAELRAYLEKPNDYISVEGRFANRTFADGSLIPGIEFMHGKKFLVEMLHLFEEPLQAEFGGVKAKFRRDLRLVRDHKNYSIGPHTDMPLKVLSLLFYLPPDDSMKQYGTSFYKPLDPTFICPGGPHHDFEDFKEIGRAPFLPNSCLGFWKTDTSFHGVAPIPVTITRDVLLYNIYRGPTAK